VKTTLAEFLNGERLPAIGNERPLEYAQHAYCSRAYRPLRPGHVRVPAFTGGAPLAG
jgi:hypothetical protein